MNKEISDPSCKKQNKAFLSYHTLLHSWIWISVNFASPYKSEVSFISEILTRRHCNAVSFGVKGAANLHEVAILLHLELYRCGLHEESVPSVLGLSHAVDAFVVVLDKHRGSRGLHHTPHLLVEAVVAVLELDFYFVISRHCCYWSLIMTFKEKTKAKKK